MNNLCLPMKVITITQKSGGSFSHPNYCLDLAGADTGIDFCYAMGNYWRCIAGPWGSNTYFFTACDSKGNAVKVHCADGMNRIVTMALTHSDFIYTPKPIIGKVYKNGEALYSEGTYGKATGNHVHLEVAEGLQYSKTYDKKMGVYRMPNELKPEDMFFICDAFSKVASMGGAVMKHCSSILYEQSSGASFKDGYQELTYENQNIKVYKQSGKEKIAVIACKYGTAIDITKFNIPLKKIKCIMNASYFMMGGDNGYLGRVQGFLNGTLEHVDARPASPAERGEKKDKAFMDLVLTKQGNISFGDFNSWDYPLSEVVFGISPAGIEIANGLSVDKYSPEVGYKKISTPNTQSMLMRCSDGKFAFGVVEGKLAPIPSLRTWGLIYGLDHLSVYDSGGSSQMIVNGEKKLYTGRKIPVVFVFYEDEGEPVIPTEPIGTVHCQLSGMHIRESVMGTIKSTVRKGDTCKLLGFVDGIQADGYQWMTVSYRGVSGYAQFDSRVLWIEMGKEGKKDENQ